MSAEDAAKAIEEVYSLSKVERKRRGEEGLKWATGKEANMTAENMSNRVIEVLDKTLATFQPRANLDFYKVEELPAKYIKHKLTGY